MDCYSPGQGLMPASFKVRTAPLKGGSGAVEEVLDPDFGESAIGRVAPVDSGNTLVAYLDFHQIFFSTWNSTFFPPQVSRLCYPPWDLILYCCPLQGCGGLFC